MTTLWSRDREIQEIARKVPDPLSMKAGSGNETSKCKSSGIHQLAERAQRVKPQSGRENRDYDCINV